MTKAEAGYTLVEMLAALAVISLTFAGLGQGVYALGARQKAASANLERTEILSSVQDELQRSLAHIKPGDIARGDAIRLEVRCASDSRCETWSDNGDRALRVQRSAAGFVLVAGADYSFSYQTPSGAQANWPLAEGEMEATLVGVALTHRTGGGLPSAYARLREQQDFHCVYDVVVASCRVAAP